MKRVERKPRVKIGEWLQNHFERNPDSALTTADVIMRAQGTAPAAITKSQRVSTIRAMKALPPPLRTVNGEGNGGQLIIYNSHNVRSYAIALMKGDWVKRYQHNFTSGLSTRHNMATRPLHLWDEAEFIAKLEIPAPGSGGYLAVQKFIAQDKGDKARVRKIKARQKVRHAAELAAIVAEFKTIGRKSARHAAQSTATLRKS